MLEDFNWSFAELSLQSSDLRLSLAFSPPGSPERERFIELAGSDTFFRRHKNLLSYDQQAMIEHGNFRHLLSNGSSNLYSPDQAPYPLHGAFPKGTCVIAGAHTSLDVPFVQSMSDRGAFVIGIGNSVQVLPEVDLWVGTRCASSYTPRAFLSYQWPSITPVTQRQEQLWDADRRSFMGVLVEECPRVYLYVDENLSTEVFFEKPAVTDFDTNTSLGVALSMAVLSGAWNIVLTGVSADMSSEEMLLCWTDTLLPPKEQMRKAEGYLAVHEMFDTFRDGCRSRGIRLYSCTEECGFSIPVMTPEELLVGTLRDNWRQVKPKDPVSLMYPLAKKKHAVENRLEVVQKQLRAPDLYEQRAGLCERLPDVFTAKLITDIETKMGEKKGGCKGCKRNRILAPLMDEWVRAWGTQQEKVLAVWKVLFPAKMSFRDPRGELVIRADKEKQG